MPSINKRVNLTLTDEVYEKLQEFKQKNGLQSDATACLQLVVRQLKALEESEQMINFMKGLKPEQLFELSKEGLMHFKDEIDKK